MIGRHEKRPRTCETVLDDSKFESHMQCRTETTGIYGMVRVPSANSNSSRVYSERVVLGHCKAQLIHSSLNIKRLLKMASISIEIGFIMAAMKDSKPSTTFAFPASASSRKCHLVAKQARSKIDKSRLSTDSESSLKGESTHPGLNHALFSQLIRTCVNSCKQTY